SVLSFPPSSVYVTLVGKYVVSRGAQNGRSGWAMFNLEPVKQYLLSNAPVVQALAQVRFPLLAKLTTLGGVAALQEALTSEFPYMEKSVETSVTFAGGVDVQPEQTVSWHFTDDEGRLLVVNANSATLSIGKQYAGIGDLADRFEGALRALWTACSIR